MPGELLIFLNASGESHQEEERTREKGEERIERRELILQRGCNIERIASKKRVG